MPRHQAPVVANQPSRPDRRTVLIVVAFVVLALAAVFVTKMLTSNSSAAPKGQQPSTRVGVSTSASQSPSTSAVSTPPVSTSATSVAPTPPPSTTTPVKPPVTTKPKPTPKKTSVAPTLIYTVQPGDNLTLIADWFKARGFEPVYDWNKTVIGRDPNLIFPGQKIIVVPGSAQQVTVGKPA